MGDRVYLDHNATTPPLPEALDEMRQVLEQDWGNPSSLHSEGQQARRALDRARARVADCLGAEPEEIVFTSGGTEAIDLALGGILAPDGRTAGHLITSAIEHPAGLAAAARIERAGGRVTRLGVDRHGRVELAAVEAAMADDTRLVSVMLANNEVGSIQPVAEVAALARAHGVACHTDAVQALGRLPVSPAALWVDLLTVSAHKLGGPKGVGALWIRRGLSIAPRLEGGRQESRRRAGTENLAGIAGFAKACTIMASGLSSRNRRLAALRDRFERGLLASLPEAKINAAAAERLPNTSSVGFGALNGDALLINLDIEGVAASTGSACHAGDPAPSHVLTAMGLSGAEARGSLRFSLGASNDEAQIDRAVEIIARVVSRMRTA